MRKDTTYGIRLKKLYQKLEQNSYRKKLQPFNTTLYENISSNNLTWFNNIKLLLNSLGLGYLLNGNVSNPEAVVHKRVTEIFFQNAFTDISSESSKLRTYCLFKKEVRREPYLSSVKNVKDRISMTKFRLSNHEL